MIFDTKVELNLNFLSTPIQSYPDIQGVQRVPKGPKYPKGTQWSGIQMYYVSLALKSFARAKNVTFTRKMTLLPSDF